MKKRLTKEERLEAMVAVSFPVKGAPRSKRDIACRRCAVRTDYEPERDAWFHSDPDHETYGTLACVDPETLKPYNNEETR